MIPLQNVLESPTEMGISGSKGATPPASKTIKILGAWVFCASIVAAHGTPVPTPTETPSSNSLAAAQIISSIVLYSGIYFSSC
jgi:hypothetical protein